MSNDSPSSSASVSPLKVGRIARPNTPVPFTFPQLSDDASSLRDGYQARANTPVPVSPPKKPQTVNSPQYQKFKSPQHQKVKSPQPQNVARENTSILIPWPAPPEMASSLMDGYQARANTPIPVSPPKKRQNGDSLRNQTASSPLRRPPSIASTSSRRSYQQLNIPLRNVETRGSKGNQLSEKKDWTPSNVGWFGPPLVKEEDAKK